MNKVILKSIGKNIEGTDQLHCYTCGKKFDRVKYECPTCGEWQCSEECLIKHIETMDAI